MKKITITEKQEAIIRRLNDPIYTTDFLKEWVNRNDNVLANPVSALQAMGAKGFFAAVRAVERQTEKKKEMLEVTGECPTCGEQYFDYETYCPACGQRLEHGIGETDGENT